MTYHSSVDCKPNRLLHDKVLQNILDHKRGLRFNPNAVQTARFADELLRRTKLLYDKTRKTVMQFYIEHKKSYDKKAKASLLEEKENCFLLQPKRDHVGSKKSSADIVGPDLY